MDFLVDTTTKCSLLFVLISIIIFICRLQNQSTRFPTNWLFFGMVPGFLVNSHRIHDYIGEFLIQAGGTFRWKGPCLANIDMVITCDPLDIHHVLCKNFINYPRGKKFSKIFEILGNGIFNSEGELWEIHRKVTMGFFKNAKYQSLMETIIWSKLENGLLPILESTCKQDMEIDLHDIFDRFTFDTTCKLLLDHDPISLSPSFPDIPFQQAFSIVEEVIFRRHYTPPILWKLQQLLGLGNEKKMAQSSKYAEDFIFECLAERQYDQCNYNINCEDQFSLVPYFMREIKEQYGAFGDPTKMLRDTLMSLMAAGKDTIGSALSWFFYILAENPTVEDKILEEIHKHLEVKMKVGQRWNSTDLGKMVYLHGALSESLRLFPPVPYNHRSSLKPDILPSGHKINKNTKVILSFYSMGRMKSIWGEDCMEFRPERWVSKTGKIKHEPSYKFPIFNAGPRTCLGKDTSLTQLKIVSAMIIYHYHIKLIEGHPVLPKVSIVLHMKHGLKVKLIKRNKAN